MSVKEKYIHAFDTRLLQSFIRLKVNGNFQLELSGPQKRRLCLNGLISLSPDYLNRIWQEDDDLSQKMSLISLNALTNYLKKDYDWPMFRNHVSKFRPENIGYDIAFRDLSKYDQTRIEDGIKIIFDTFKNFDEFLEKMILSDDVTITSGMNLSHIHTKNSITKPDYSNHAISESKESFSSFTENEFVIFKEAIYKEIKEHPVWKNDINTIQIIGLMSRIMMLIGNDYNKPLCLLVKGTRGSTKTTLVKTVIHKYLFFLGRIHSNDKEKIIKIYPSMLKRLTDSKKRKLIENEIARSIGGILIFSDFRKCSDIELLIEYLKQIGNSYEFRRTCIVIMGRSVQVNPLISVYGLTSFSDEYSIHLKPPSIDAIVELFISFAYREGKYILPKKAIRTAKYYFIILQKVKKLRSSLRKPIPIKEYLSTDTRFKYAHEVLSLYSGIKPFIKHSGYINKSDITASIAFKSIITEHRVLTRYIESLRALMSLKKDSPRH